jgi:hypothetical protein
MVSPVTFVGVFVSPNEEQKCTENTAVLPWGAGKTLGN